ncbi:hypothetical protein OH77DRAFT_1522573 [Trametes cingulata]|nr:hypothetical protein OH77DRAFT_1522573 [Trametes cingulata]
MSPKRKAGAASKPSAQPKPVATTSKTPAATTSNAAPSRAPQASTAGPSATSSTQRVSPPPTAAPSRPGVTIQPNPVAPPPRTFAQPSRPTAQPAKSALAPHLRNAPAAAAPAPTPAPRTAPAQKRTFTRSDRVRAEWHDFEAAWVRPRQSQIEQELEELFKAAERTIRTKGKGGTPNGMDKIVNQMQRDFALAARDEWDARLQRAGLQAEDWTDMTLEEMISVEQVLAYEDSESEPGVYAQVYRGASTDSVNSGSTAVPDTTPPTAPRSIGGWKTHTATTSQTAPSQKTGASQPLRNTQSVAPQHPMPAEAPDQATKKPAQGRGAKGAPVAEDLRPSTKGLSGQQSSKVVPAVAPLPTTTELLVYAVPVALTQPPLDPALAENVAYMAIVEKLHINSIHQFHTKAIDADIELARQLRKPMPPADREFAIRSHQMTMEQCARDIVARRNELLEKERKRLGLGGDSASAPTAPPAPQARSAQPPGAFPEERAQPARQPPSDPEPLLEYTPDAEPEPEREPEEVDEVIEIPIKGKGKKKGKKAAVETKPATNGRSTPTPVAAAAPSSARAATPVQKATPAADAKGKSPAPAVSPWNTAKTSAPARAASPAPINTKLGSSSTNGRSSPAPSPSSSTPTPWEIHQAKAAGASASTASDKATPPPNEIWAPPMARATSSNKNPFAPARPSRLAQVTSVPEPEPVPQSPESPEPPSPPAGEPTGRDYVAWFAGSSSEDDDSTYDGMLDEDEDEDENEAQSSGAAGIGGLLASLAGASPWALFGESNQPQKRAASPARGRGTTPTPARAAAGRFTPAPDTQPAYARWGAPTAGPSGYSAGPSSAQHGPPGMWKQEEGDDLEQMLDLATSTLDRAAKGSARGGGVNIEEAMAMYVTASKARETLSTPVGGRSGRKW